MPRYEVAFNCCVPGSNLLGTLEGVVVARNVRHDCTLIRFGGVDQICFTFERRMFRIYTSLQKYFLKRTIRPTMSIGFCAA